MTLVAGVDSSTQSCTVELRDADTGELRGRGSAPHSPTFPPVSEQDPQEWWQALTAAFASACRSADIAPHDVAAVSVDGQCHGLVLLDGAGLPTRPAQLWNDTTSADAAHALVVAHGAEFWIDHIGSVPGPAFLICKIKSILQKEPHAVLGAGHLLLPHDYLTWRLTGQFVTDRADASGTGYFQPRSGTWQPDLLALVGPDVDWAARLPRILGPQEAAGCVAPAAADQLGVASTTLVGPGTGDQYASALGLGIGLGDVVVGLGTSGVVFAVHDEPVSDVSGWVNGMADASGRFLPIVVTLNATKVTDWAGSLLGVDHDGLSALALAENVDSATPMTVAYFDGERAPNRPHARGAIADLSREATREGFAYSVVEGVLLGLNQGIDKLRDVGVRVDGRLIVTGGGGRAAAFRQILADITGREVVILDVDESSARGACVQAAAVLHQTTVEQVAASWRPGTRELIAPRLASWADERKGRYAELAAWSGLDKESQ